MISSIQDEINNNLKELIDINKLQKFAIKNQWRPKEDYVKGDIIKSKSKLDDI